MYGDSQPVAKAITYTNTGTTPAALGAPGARMASR
ncbi:hypothetical protein DFJ69_1854 [Thermomonospora umbrina]|uniref:Uncharacterized protein n=1 Tax=Thermomonospora umbrina TaxID=111806 RepID=A0A3D9SKL0_9ACTN|nr:hypothetical protein DFJ69_1854 [Thermomonospora umbrina]